MTLSLHARIMRAVLIGLAIGITSLGIVFNDTHEGESLILLSLITTPGIVFMLVTEYTERRRA